MNNHDSIIKSSGRVFLIGLIMGAAEVVPGVSGGTIAFVTGIYERLVSSIKQLNPLLLLTLKTEGIHKTWQQINGNFLLTLFSAMVLAVLLLARGLSYLLVQQPILIWAFFFGLVLASIWVMVRQIVAFDMQNIGSTKWRYGLIAWISCGVAIGIGIARLVPINLEPTPWVFMLGGAVAVCAWILPGLSGSFILLILGLYQFVIEAIKTFDIILILNLVVGCGVGIVSFSQVLSRLFSNYRQQTQAVLVGFMLGALYKLWPWQNTLSYQIYADGSQVPLKQVPVSPSAYSLITGANPEYLLATLGLISGLIAVLGLNMLNTNDGRYKNQMG